LEVIGLPAMIAGPTIGWTAGTVCCVFASTVIAQYCMS